MDVVPLFNIDGVSYCRQVMSRDCLPLEVRRMQRTCGSRAEEPSANCFLEFCTVELMAITAVHSCKLDSIR